jgi:hypothetical protein
LLFFGTTLSFLLNIIPNSGLTTAAFIAQKNLQHRHQLLPVSFYSWGLKIKYFYRKELGKLEN